MTLIDCRENYHTTVTEDDGTYTLFVPHTALLLCTRVTLQARATGYWQQVLTVPSTGLYADPERSFILIPLYRF